MLFLKITSTGILSHFEAWKLKFRIFSTPFYFWKIKKNWWQKFQSISNLKTASWKLSHTLILEIRKNSFLKMIGVQEFQYWNKIENIYIYENVIIIKINWFVKFKVFSKIIIFSQFQVKLYLENTILCFSKIEKKEVENFFGAQHSCIKHI